MFVAYPGAEILDVTGPAAVFSSANQFAPRPLYEVLVVSSQGGVLTLTGDIGIGTRSTRSVAPRSVDTVLLVGGSEGPLRAAMNDASLRRFVMSASKMAERWGAVCSGAFLLGHYGLIHGRRVATHWNGCSALSQMYPTVKVDADALYVVDGRVWTSAGVTTGIDMALAMVEKDAGPEVAARVAQHLVLYGRRPGFQSQFSPLLRAQTRGAAPYSDLIDFIQANLSASLKVPALARRCGQSLRDFHRKFAHVTGKTPSRFVEDLRLEQVRTLLQHNLSLKEIAVETGFGSAVRMARAFERRFGLRPSVFRELHRTAA